MDFWICLSAFYNILSYACNIWSYSAFSCISDQAQQNKLLMIARRSVADIPREKLVEADTDGDT